MTSRRPWSITGNGLRSTPSTTLNMAVVAPMPTASVPPQSVQTRASSGAGAGSEFGEEGVHDLVEGSLQLIRE